MAISEKLCWEILRLAQNRSVSPTWLKGSESADPPQEHAIPQITLEHQLVLQYKKNQIEDAFYFLEKRGYLRRHGFQGWTRVAFQLSELAHEAFEKNSFSLEEQQAFSEDIIEIKPGAWGVWLNPKELWRRAKKKMPW